MFRLELDEEITIRQIEESDAVEIFQLTEKSRDVLREWMPWVDGTKTVRDTLHFIQLTLDAYDATRALNCGIIYRDKLCGMVSFSLIDWQNQMAHIGYWLSTDFQGKGIMSRAVRGLLEYGFYELELNRIEIRAAIDNKKSRAIPERFGFQQEGVIRQTEWLYDHFVDHAVYGMLRADWISV